MWLTTVQITSKEKISSTGFLYSILELCTHANVAHGESCLFMPCRNPESLRHYESLQLWELWNLFKESLPKATSNALDKAYLATMKCVVVSKAFKKVAKERTKTLSGPAFSVVLRGPDAKNQGYHQPIEMKLCQKYAWCKIWVSSIFEDMTSQNFTLKHIKLSPYFLIAQ